MTSELIRYLGWPAQAISYKVGERALACGARNREEAAGRSRSTWKRFHGGVGLRADGGAAGARDGALIGRARGGVPRLRTMPHESTDCTD